MYDLTQLEGAGFNFTELEKMVFNNPSFQFLHGKGWPIRWGSLATGLTAKVSTDYYQNEVISFKSVDGEKLTPHGAGIFFDEIATHIRSVSVLVAKVARDASNNELDQRFVQDLSFWFDGLITYPGRPFRWAEFERKHAEKMKREAREAEVAVLSQGYASVVILLVDMLVGEHRENIFKAVKADCIKRKIFEDEDEHRNDRYYHLPWSKCMLCNEPPGRIGGRHCDNFNSIALVDCGDVPTIIKSIPVDFRRIVKSVRFKVPKSTFSDKSGHIGTALFPQFAVFSLSLLSEEERRKFRSELGEELRKKQAEWLRSHGPGYYDRCQIIAPAGRQKLNALLLAGPSATWSTWSYMLGENELWNELLKNKKMRVDLVE